MEIVLLSGHHIIMKDDMTPEDLSFMKLTKMDGIFLKRLKERLLFICLVIPWQSQAMEIEWPLEDSLLTVLGLGVSDCMRRLLHK